MHKPTRDVRCICSPCFLPAFPRNHLSPGDPTIKVPGPSLPLMGYAALVSSSRTEEEAIVTPTPLAEHGFRDDQMAYSWGDAQQVETWSQQAGEAVTPAPRASAFTWHFCPSCLLPSSPTSSSIQWVLRGQGPGLQHLLSTLSPSAGFAKDHFQEKDPVAETGASQPRVSFPEAGVGQKGPT